MYNLQATDDEPRATFEEINAGPAAVVVLKRSQTRGTKEIPNDNKQGISWPRE